MWKVWQKGARSANTGHMLLTPGVVLLQGVMPAGVGAAGACVIAADGWRDLEGAVAPLLFSNADVSCRTVPAR